MAEGTLNEALLDEVNASHQWRGYRKVKPIWVRRLNAVTTVATSEGTLQYQAGDYLCRGEAGDVWGQKASTLEAKYLPETPGTTDAEGWLRYIPNPSSNGVYAVRMSHDFMVQHVSFGAMTGCWGDFLVKSAKDQGVQYPADIWVVKEAIFLDTYQPEEN